MVVVFTKLSTRPRSKTSKGLSWYRSRDLFIADGQVLLFVIRYLGFVSL